jgi:hypothetical protein
MFSKTQIALSAAMVLSIGFPASTATKHHRVYNMWSPQRDPMTSQLSM